MATRPTNKLPATQPGVLKLSLGARTHRVSVDLATLTFDGLVAHVKAALADALPAQWALEYTDDEGDRVTLSHARELGEAIGVLLGSANGGNPTLAFRVVPRTVPLSRRIAPLLKRMGQLSASVARVASERSIQLRNSDVVSRGRASLTSSATRTGSLLRAAGRGVASGLQHAQSAVSTSIERRRSRSSSASSLSLASPSSSASPFPSPSPSFAETGDKHSDAALSPTPTPMSEAEIEVVDLRASLSSSEANATDDAESDASAEYQHAVDEAAYASDADTLASCDEEDREWDLVATTEASSASAAVPLCAEYSWKR